MRRRWVICLLVLALGCGSEASNQWEDVTAQDLVEDGVSGEGRIPVDVRDDDGSPPDVIDRELPGGDLDAHVPEDFVHPDADVTAEVVDLDALPGDDGDAEGDGLEDLGDDLTDEDVQALEVEQELPEPCVAGTTCDDGDPCTMNDWCVEEGICEGEPYVCDDGRTCTLDVCDGLGNCSYTLLIGRCLINGLCHKSGDLKSGNQCVVCQPHVNAWSWTVLNQQACDDGDACTTGDRCVSGICAGNPVLCVDGNPCTRDLCLPAFGCSHPPANIPCDDGDFCTAGDFCEGGECLPGPLLPCEDYNPCTQSHCHPDIGCYYTNVDGVPCDDGNACSVGDLCMGGLCMGGMQQPVCDDWNDCTADICDPAVGCIFPLAGNPCCVLDINICFDGDPCTIDSCNPDTGACVYFANDGPCSDGDACTVGDVCQAGVCSGIPANCDDGNPCTADYCHSALGCVHESVNTSCDDGNVCTLNDWCTGGLCKGTALNCNDYNLCTDDQCHPVQGCIQTPNTAACNDQNLCTTADRCSGGQCIGTPRNCNDGNPCTTDSCHPTSGCQNVFNQVPCDNGNPCTVGDYCSGGVCVAGTVVCASCAYDFSTSVSRASTMQISTTATSTTALDLDGNGTFDNSMAGLAGLANGPLSDAVSEGKVHLLLEHNKLKTNGGLYTLAGFIGKLAPGFEACAFSTAYCGYVVDPEGMDLDACRSMITFNNASIVGGVLTAGGPGYQFPFQIPLSDGPMLSVTLYAARVKAQVTVQGGMVTGMQGIIGGAIPKSSFVSAIEALPDDALPLPKSMILQMVDILIVNDIDTDGNGQPDAASIAISFQAIAAGIVGIE